MLVLLYHSSSLHKTLVVEQASAGLVQLVCTIRHLSSCSRHIRTSSRAILWMCLFNDDKQVEGGGRHTYQSLKWKRQQRRQQQQAEIMESLCKSLSVCILRSIKVSRMIRALDWPVRRKGRQDFLLHHQHRQQQQQQQQQQWESQVCNPIEHCVLGLNPVG